MTIDTSNNPASSPAVQPDEIVFDRTEFFYVFAALGDDIFTKDVDRQVDFFVQLCQHYVLRFDDAGLYYDYMRAVFFETRFRSDIGVHAIVRSVWAAAHPEPQPPPSPQPAPAPSPAPPPLEPMALPPAAIKVVHPLWPEGKEVESFEASEGDLDEDDDDSEMESDDEPEDEHPRARRVSVRGYPKPIFGDVVWFPFPGFPDYAISSKGVMRLRGGLRNAKAGMILSQFYSVAGGLKGQMCVNLRHNGKTSSQSVGWALLKAKRAYDKSAVSEPAAKPKPSKPHNRYRKTPGEQGYDGWRDGGKDAYNDFAEYRSENPEE